jgi:hypothetical protein
MGEPARGIHRDYGVFPRVLDAPDTIAANLCNNRAHRSRPSRVASSPRAHPPGASTGPGSFFPSQVPPRFRGVDDVTG